MRLNSFGFHKNYHDKLWSVLFARLYEDRGGVNGDMFYWDRVGIIDQIYAKTQGYIK